MNRIFVSVGTILLAAAFLLVGCTQSGTVPAPTQAVQTPPSSAEPTAVPTTAPSQPSAAATTAPVQKASFPEKGKPISVIVPFAAGGGTDVAARILTPLLEKELGTSVQVVNKAGAGSQLGNTELATSKPDGYTIGYLNLPTTVTTYLDPERKAVFSRKSFDLLALQNYDTGLVAVGKDSPYKSLKELIDDAKANPGKIKASTAGILSNAHLNLLMMQRASGAKFTIVHFDGAAAGRTALLGNHIDVFFGNTTDGPTLVSGGARILGLADKQRSKFFPDVPTYEEQGYDVSIGVSYGVAAPAGLPKEALDVLSAALKKVISGDEFQKKVEALSLSVRYLDPAQYSAYWAEVEEEMKPLVDMAKQ